MHKVIIKNLENKITNQGQFESLEQAQSWVDGWLSQARPWGYQKEHWSQEFLEGAETREVEGEEGLVTEYLHPQDFSYEILDITEQHAIEQQLSEAYELLRSTDWYYARLLEIDEEVPQDIKSQRIAAREFIRLHIN